jgi:hypothetical protein
LPDAIRRQIDIRIEKLSDEGVSKVLELMYPVKHLTTGEERAGEDRMTDVLQYLGILPPDQRVSRKELEKCLLVLVRAVKKRDPGALKEKSAEYKSAMESSS